MMLFTTGVIYMLIGLVHSGLLAKRHCDDCRYMYACTAAKKLTQSNTAEGANRLSKAFCGFDNKGIKICCSDFEFEPLHIADAIELHENTKLLPQSCGESYPDRIHGGSTTMLYEFPWMALISYWFNEKDLYFGCAGSVINSLYILTAAHCIVDRNIAGVRIGEFDITTKIDCQDTTCESHLQDILVNESFVHHKYDGHPNYAYDIGLIRLARPINFTYKNAAPICLPISQNSRKTVYNKATVAGWGLTENVTDSSVLLKVTIPIRAKSECFQFYSRLFSPEVPELEHTQFCAGTINKDACKGDSGGPLMAQSLRYVQLGIVSNGPQKCGSEVPGVYTDVIKLMDWILDTIKP